MDFRVRQIEQSTTRLRSRRASTQRGDAEVVAGTGHFRAQKTMTPRRRG